LARQRSGTGALNTIFHKIDGVAPLGEVLHPDWRGLGNIFKGYEDSSFHGWVSRRASGPVRHDQLAELFGEYISELETHSSINVVDIKLNSLHALQPSFRSITLPPWILSEFMRRKTPIIWLRRENLVDCWISGLMAHANQVWHTTDVGCLVHSKVAVDMTELKNFVQSAYQEEKYLEGLLSGYSPLLSITYEETFQRDGMLSDAAQEKIAAFIDVDRERFPRQPSIAKQTSWALEEKVENYREVEEYSRWIRGAYDGAAPSKTSIDLAATLPPEFVSRVNARLADLRRFDQRGTLPSALVQGKVIVDWEAGDLAFSVALLLSGAEKVFAIDCSMQFQQIPTAIKELPRLKILRGSIIDFLSLRKASFEIGGRVDLIFSNTVTEHIQALPASFKAASELLESGGYLFTNHDNYYQPVGSHDHGFLYYGEDNKIAFQGIRCWERNEKCTSSENHRREIATKFPWTWDASLDALCDPARCQECPYFRRSQPWAHLIYQDDFNRLFPGAAFKTGVEGASLNKVTLFQLRQYILESGFHVITEQRNRVSNELPAKKLDQFTRDELLTTTAEILAQR
jgi:2-polyprenyl-6-hydroxyphenyl methylase/3-demethylubiquinone-9 3-methyltransferase